MNSSSVGVANGPRLIVESIIGSESLCVTVTCDIDCSHTEITKRSRMHNLPLPRSVAIVCIRPSSASSDMANRSRCCFFHHSVLSGIVEGAAVPYTRVIGSSSLPVEQPLRPASCRFLFVKKSSATMMRFKNQNPPKGAFAKPRLNKQETIFRMLMR